MISTIVIVIICFSIIIHHLYKIKDELNDIKEQIADSAKWADKTMIEKACSWLDKALDNFYIGTQQANFTDKVKFIESFKKAMRNSYETLDSTTTR